MFDTPSCQLIEEHRNSLLGEGFSEQLVEDLYKIADSYDKLRQININQADRQEDRDLANFFEQKFIDCFTKMQENRT